MVGAVSIDLRKVCDTVDHSLSGKLERYGDRNDDLRWFVILSVREEKIL